MPISKSRPRRPRQRVTPLDAPLTRPKDDSPNWTDGGHRPPPQAVLDKLAEATIHGGYAGKRYDTCPTCFMRRTRKGGCNCLSDVDTRKIKKLGNKVKRSALADALGDV